MNDLKEIYKLSSIVSAAKATDILHLVNIVAHTAEKLSGYIEIVKRWRLLIFPLDLDILTAKTSMSRPSQTKPN